MGAGKTQILSSGQATSDALVYTAKYNTLGYGTVTVGVECIRLGSGVAYTIRGYPVEGFPKTYSIVSGQILTSGVTHVKVFTNAYEVIDVGVNSVQSNHSGVINVYVTGKRR